MRVLLVVVKKVAITVGCFALMIGVGVLLSYIHS